MIEDQRCDQYFSSTNPGGFATGASFPARLPLAGANPPDVPQGNGLAAAGDGVLVTGSGGAHGPRNLTLIPYGTGGAGSTFNMSMLGWCRTPGFSKQESHLWVPVLMATFAVTLGSASGVPNYELGPNVQFATTITQTYGPTFIVANALTVPDYFVLSPGGNAIGMIVFRALGFRFVETIYALGTAQGANALYARM